MTSLRELQRDFLRAILEDPAAAPALPVISNRIAAAERLQVYAGNARVNFSSALESSYPVVRRLVGAAYFEQCAHRFQREHPSRSGDLQPAGALFAGYIDALHRDGGYRYLGDVARFEWLLQEALLAADHAPFDMSKLAAVPPGDYDSLEFHLHPSVRLFESRYPCLAIWQANTAAEEPPVIDLDASPHARIAIVQSGGELRFLVLSVGEQAFLAALAVRTPFVRAVDAAGAAAHDAAAGAAASAAIACDFDAGDALRRFVAAGAIVDFHHTPS
jgi:hypothetical protein